MRKSFTVLMGAALAAAAISMAFAQAEHQITDKGWIDIDSTKETATLKRPMGSIYKNVVPSIYTGKPPKPYKQSDIGGYILDPAPAGDRNKPYSPRDLAHVWEHLINSGGGISPRVPPMTEEGYKLLDTHIVAGGPRGYMSQQKEVNAPELMCDPIGFPGVIYGTTRPMEMIQIPGRVIQHFAWHESWRTIWMDGRLLPKPPMDLAWMGYSVGKWVGNTLVADTNGVDHRAWIDRMGTAHSDNALFQERWRRIDHNTLQFNLTLKDPEIYKETWESSDDLFELYPQLEVDHTPCVPSEEFEYRENTPTEIPSAGAK